MPAKPKILIVDDLPKNLFALRSVLEQTEAEIVEARSGNEALTLILNNDFSVAVVDIQMPEMSGFEFVGLLRQDAARENYLPVIFLSAVYDDPKTISEAYAYGAVDFLSKPINDKALIAKVEVFLSITKAKSDLKAKNVELAGTLDRLSLLNKQFSSQRKALNGSAAMSVFDKKGSVFFTNSRFNKLADCEKKSAETPLFHDLLGLEKAFFENMSVQAEKTGEWRNEIRTIDRRGQRHWTDAVVVPYRDAGYDDTHFLFVGFDISRRKMFLEELKRKNAQVLSARKELRKANKKLTESNQNLELKVVERSRELIRTNEELDLFLYRASHDLRGPIATLLGLLNLASEDESDEKSADYYDKLNSTAVGMSAVVDKLLMAHAVNHLNIDTTVIDFQAITKEATRLLSSEIKDKNIELHCEIEVGFDYFSDPEIVKVIVMNLLENAVHFSDPTKENKYINLIISTKGDKISLEIEDNGIGIPTEFQGKIYNMFFRGDERSRGNGLGLYLAKKALDKIKGEIQTVSEEDKFSRFSVVFPKLEILQNREAVIES